ncbi:MAG: hypothetical protein KC502_02000 [Myxococcales bacterium]|nr:hypothetical protein [Myxococcales bacterium]
MTRRFALLLVCSLALSGLSGCSKSVEGELKSWDANKLSAQEFSAKYSGFKPAIESRVAEATKDMKAAEALSGEAKIKAMSVANAKLNTILFRFRAVERKMREWDSLKRDSDLRRIPMGVVRGPMESAEGAVRRTLHMLKTKTPANAGEAIGRLKSAETRMTKAFAPLKALKRKAAKVRAKARKAKKAAKKAGK